MIKDVRLKPPFDLGSSVIQQKYSEPDALSNDPLRLGDPSDARYPLITEVVGTSIEPVLGRDDQFACRCVERPQSQIHWAGRGRNQDQKLAETGKRFGDGNNVGSVRQSSRQVHGSE